MQKFCKINKLYYQVCIYKFQVKITAYLSLPAKYHTVFFVIFTWAMPMK